MARSRTVNGWKLTFGTTPDENALPLVTASKAGRPDVTTIGDPDVDEELLVLRVMKTANGLDEQAGAGGEG